MVWLALGLVALGLLGGLLAGLSLSPVVGGLLSLLFAFAGGSVGVFQKNRTPKDVAFLGRSLFFLCTSMLLGLFGGIYLRNANPLGSAAVQPGFFLGSPLSVSDIVGFHEKRMPTDFMRILVQADRLEHYPRRALTAGEIAELSHASLPAAVLEAMLLPAVKAEGRPTSTFLYENRDTFSPEEDLRLLREENAGAPQDARQQDGN